MTWNRATFDIVHEDGTTRETVSGWASTAGIGIHVEKENIDGQGCHRWNVTHLRSGILFLRLNLPENMAIEAADVIAKQAKWSQHESLYDLSEADPEWIPRLLGIKHVLNCFWMEFPKPELNDPRNMVLLPPGMTMQ